MCTCHLSSGLKDKDAHVLPNSYVFNSCRVGTQKLFLAVQAHLTHCPHQAQTMNYGPSILSSVADLAICHPRVSQFSYCTGL